MTKKPSELAGIAAGIVVVLGGLAYLGHRASMPPQPMPPDELRRVARQLASDARESERLAKLAGAAQLNEHYARAQHRKIAEDVHDARDKLDAPPPKDREDDVKRLGDLAARMKELLDDTAPRLADRAALQRLQEEHGRIAAELERLAAR